MSSDEREERAWNAYLAAIQAIPEHDLDALEPVEWRALQKRLRAIREPSRERVVRVRAPRS